MMGSGTLSTNSERLRAAFAGERRNLITALDRKIRKLTKDCRSVGTDFRSLSLLHSAVEQVVGEKPRKTVRTKRGREDGTTPTHVDYFE
jgi:hypothetical protein